MFVELTTLWVVQVEWDMVYCLPLPIPNPKIALNCLSKTKLFIACHFFFFERKSCNFQKPTLFTIQLKQRKTDLIGTVWMLEGELELEKKIGCSPYGNKFIGPPFQICVLTRSGEMTIN